MLFNEDILNTIFDQLNNNKIIFCKHLLLETKNKKIKTNKLSSTHGNDQCLFCDIFIPINNLKLTCSYYKNIIKDLNFYIKIYEHEIITNITYGFIIPFNILKKLEINIELPLEILLQYNINELSEYNLLSTKIISDKYKMYSKDIDKIDFTKLNIKCNKISKTKYMCDKHKISFIKKLMIRYENRIINKNFYDKNKKYMQPVITDYINNCENMSSLDFLLNKVGIFLEEHIEHHETYRNNVEKKIIGLVGDVTENLISKYDKLLNFYDICNKKFIKNINDDLTIYDIFTINYLYEKNKEQTMKNIKKYIFGSSSVLINVLKKIMDKYGENINFDNYWENLNPSIENNNKIIKFCSNEYCVIVKNENSHEIKYSYNFDKTLFLYKYLNLQSKNILKNIALFTCPSIENLIDHCLDYNEILDIDEICLILNNRSEIIKKEGKYKSASLGLEMLEMLSKSYNFNIYVVVEKYIKANMKLSNNNDTKNIFEFYIENSDKTNPIFIK